MKKLIPFIVILLSLPVLAMAPKPCPLGFFVLTSPPGVTGLHLTITYDDRTWNMLEQYPGEYTLELGNKNIPNCNFQNFNLVIKECEGNPICHQTVSFNPDGYTTIDITSVNLFITTTVIPTTIPTTIPKPCYTEAECREACDGWIVCEECKKCKEPIVNLKQLIVYLIIVFGFGFTAQTGYKFVVRETKSGKKEIQITQHKHKGKYEYYHSIHSKHSDENYRHPVNKAEVKDLMNKLNLTSPDFDGEYKKWIYGPEYTIHGKKFSTGGS